MRLDFLSAPQETPEGKEMRAWITDYVQPVDRARMRECACHNAPGIGIRDKETR